ncbi:MAG: hypothetical protein ACLT3Q_05040 [Alistipes finegoldii]
MRLLRRRRRTHRFASANRTSQRRRPDGKTRGHGGRPQLRLETTACDHLLLYIYIVPHTLPAGNDIADTQPFEITLRIAYGGKVLRSEKRLINQWSGASVEMRVDRQDK